MKKEKIGIVRPCKIGDLIISLPIGKYYFDKGYDVHWPIMSKYYQMFQEVAGHYIKFIPITNLDFFVVNSAKQELINRKISNILNLTFNVGSFDDINSLTFSKLNIPFDQLIYKLANVPFEQKWNLDIKRNTIEEENIYNRLIKNNKYSICHFEVDYNKYKWQKGQQTRDGYFNLCKNKIKNQFIEINNAQNVKNIFYWLKMLENSEQLFLVDSSILNLVEGLNISVEKYILLRSNKKETPTIKNDWIII
jgi:hypothetical protein